MNGCPAFCNDAPKLKADSLELCEADVARGESAGEVKQRADCGDITHRSFSFASLTLG